MDFVDWVMYVSGGAFGLLTLGLGLSRLSAFTERDINPIWWLGFIVFGGLLALSLIVDWIVPIQTTVYLANGGDTPREVVIDTKVVCLPGKSYDAFHWRLARPKNVTVMRSETESQQTYPLGKGTWLVNASRVGVSADMYERGNTAIDFQAVSTHTAGTTSMGARFGRPFRMFSQSGFDRIYNPSGDIEQGSTSGPCEKQIDQKPAEEK